MNSLKIPESQLSNLNWRIMDTEHCTMLKSKKFKTLINWSRDLLILWIYSQLLPYPPAFASFELFPKLRCFLDWRTSWTETAGQVYRIMLIIAQSINVFLKSQFLVSSLWLAFFPLYSLICFLAFLPIKGYSDIQ